MRVLFLGNHTVGVRTLEAICVRDEVAGVVAHPRDSEDGTRYLSVHDFAVARGWTVIRCTGTDRRLFEFATSLRPDLILIADYRYLLPASILAAAPRGVVNLHPSLLPRYRGRAPLNWAILHGETTLGLTAHFVEEAMDSGDIIAQESFHLGENQDVGDALEILYPMYTRITSTVLDAFRSGRVPRTPQDHRQATAFPRRRPEDGCIDWGRPANQVLNLVRAVAHPYPGAFTTLGGEKIMVWKAQRSTAAPDVIPGTVLTIDRGALRVRCADQALTVTRWEAAPSAPPVLPGTVLGS